MSLPSLTELSHRCTSVLASVVQEQTKIYHPNDWGHSHQEEKRTLWFALKLPCSILILQYLQSLGWWKWSMWRDLLSLPSSEMYRQWSTYIGCVLQCVTHCSFHVELEAKFIFPVYSHDVIGYVVDHGSLASSSSTKKHDNLLWRSIFGEWLTDVQFVAFHLSLLLTLAAYIQLGAHPLFSSYFLAKPSVSPNQWNLFQWKTVGNIRNMDRYT